MLTHVILLIISYMTFWFILSTLKKDNSLVDIAWGLGFVLLAWVSFFSSEQTNARSLLVSGLVTIWGIRLSWHIAHRHKKEDPRYRAFRESWGMFFLVRSFLQIFMLQGALMLIIASSFIWVNTHSNPALTYLDFIGLSIWLMGFLCEALSDYQLARFLATRTDSASVMSSGLWRYSRHPNYFGEALLWWGIYVIALSVHGSFWTIISPITITLLVRFISGVPLLEKMFADNKAFQLYKTQTNIFFPWKPKL